MKDENLSGALLFLLGMLPKRVEREQETMRILHNGETITVNELIIRVIDILDKHAESEEKRK